MKRLILALTLTAFATAATATWRLTKGYFESTQSQATADAGAKDRAIRQCERVYNGEVGGTSIVKRDTEIIVGYGGMIWVYSAKAVAGCSY